MVYLCLVPVRASLVPNDWRIFFSSHYSVTCLLPFSDPDAKCSRVLGRPISRSWFAVFAVLSAVTAVPHFAAGTLSTGDVMAQIQAAAVATFAAAPLSTTTCGPGQAGEEGDCRRCPVGTWSDAVGLASRADCSPCPSGSFSGVLGATSSSICTPCPAGSFAEDRGAGFCEACPAGSWSFGGASQCTDLLLPCAAIGAAL